MEERGIILQAAHVTKYFYDPEKFRVLDDVQLSVRRGEFVSIVGKSGCGKSTLLYLLSTLDTSYEGTIHLAGKCITGCSQNELAMFRNKHIGFVFQFHFLLPEFTALQNVMLPALKLGAYSEEEIEVRAYAGLERLGMKDFAQKQASKLSGGQAQRVAIARALINDPDIIMGDEPTGNLDTANTAIVYDILRDLSRERQQTIIAVTHDADFANRSDRIIEMRDGRIVSG